MIDWLLIINNSGLSCVDWMFDLVFVLNYFSL